MAHEITIGDNPQASAEIQASLIRSDIQTGQAQPPGDHVVYHDPGPSAPDTWKSPAELNASGKGSCNSLVRAVAPFVDASHVGVAETTDPKTGETVQHAFLVTAPQPGQPTISVGADGKATAPIPADRILDPSVARGMNGGKAPPLSLYQSAALAPINPPGKPDLSHVTAPPTSRAAEGNAYSGATRLSAPATTAGAAVAAASQIAGRAVTPPVEHVARPAGELYP